MCWNVNPDTGEGTCIALCDGDGLTCSAEPWSCCPLGSSCTIASGGALILCLPTCHPIVQNCSEVGVACYPVGETFQCAPDVSGEAGAPGDPCEGINTCDPGTYCGDPLTYPGCDPNAAGCCIPFCDNKSPDCPMGTACKPWYGPGEASPVYDDLGACVIP